MQKINKFIIIFSKICIISVFISGFVVLFFSKEIKQLNKTIETLQLKIYESEEKNIYNTIDDEIECYPKKTQDEIKKLLVQKDNIVSFLGEKYLDLSDIIQRINSARRELEIINSDISNIYLICIKLQYTNTIDKSNSTKLWIAVDKRLYDSIEKGNLSLNKSNNKSLIFGEITYNWQIIVIDKKIN